MSKRINRRIATFAAGFISVGIALSAPAAHAGGDGSPAVCPDWNGVPAVQRQLPAVQSTRVCPDWNGRQLPAIQLPAVQTGGNHSVALAPTAID